MSDLLAARSQMAMSLAFHIMFAVVGIGMPLLMVIAEGLWIRTGKPHYLMLVKRWAKGTAIIFAVGAVSGTVLSFELGLLWPRFMELAGPVIGMPFSLEGFAFFFEAIFLGIYLYGWDKISARAHWFAGFLVMVSGMLSGIFVVCANAFMNTPAGFTLHPDGSLATVDVWAAMWNPAAFSQTLHMTLASFVAIGFLVAGIHGRRLLQGSPTAFDRSAFRIALGTGAVFACLMPLSGHLSAQHVARHQPVKFAAMEAHFHTARGVPAVIGGIADEEAAETRWALHIPKAMSLLAFDDPDAEIRGLTSFDRDLWPPVNVVHIAFQIMIACSMAMLSVGLYAFFLAWRRRQAPLWYLRVCVLAAPLGFIAIQAGWTVTEVGRQPWIIHGVMRTADALTPMPGLVVPFAAMSALYLVLAAIVVTLLKRHVFAPL